MDIQPSTIYLPRSLLLNKRGLQGDGSCSFPSVAVLKYSDLKQFKGGEDLLGSSREIAAHHFGAGGVKAGILIS